MNSEFLEIIYSYNRVNNHQSCIKTHDVCSIYEWHWWYSDSLLIHYMTTEVFKMKLIQLTAWHWQIHYKSHQTINHCHSSNLWGIMIQLLDSLCSSNCTPMPFTWTWVLVPTTPSWWMDIATVGMWEARGIGFRPMLALSRKVILEGQSLSLQICCLSDGHKNLFSVVRTSTPWLSLLWHKALLFVAEWPRSWWHQVIEEDYFEMWAVADDDTAGKTSAMFQVRLVLPWATWDPLETTPSAQGISN